MSHPEKIIKAVAVRVALVLSLALPLATPALAHAAPAATPPALKSVRASVSGAATFITVDATSPMAYTVRRPGDELLVVELHGVNASALAPSYTVASPLVAGIAVKRSMHEGGTQTSLEISLRAPARERSHMSDTSLVVELWPEKTAATADAARPAATTDAAAKANDPVPGPPAAAQQPADRTSGGEPASQQGQRYGQPGFVGEPISLNVVNADIRDILNYITEQYGVNFIIDASVQAIPVTVNVTDVPWNIALDSILKANRLGVEANGNILRVATTAVLAGESEVQSRIRAAALENSPLTTEYVRLNYARAAGTLSNAAGSTGNFSGGSTGQSFSGGAGGQNTDAGILPIIKRRLSKRGSAEFDGRSNTLIITDVQENIDSIRKLITLLDQPEPQVEIETRIVIATRNFSRDLGVQLQAAVFGARGSGGAFETAPSQAGLNPQGLPGGLFNTPPSSGGLGVPGASTVIGLTTGIFGTAQIGALITAAERNGQAKIVATPRVTALNNRPAQIESGSQIPVVTPQAGTGGTLGGANVFTTTFVSVPLRLSVTPQITDAGTVILRVVAENNNVNLTLVNTFGTPGIDTQRMQTEVLVPDGGTTVIGGVLNDREAETQNRTPGLSGIPVIGNLFKRRTTRRDTDELLFFITPRIYRPDYQGRRIEAQAQTGTRFVSVPQPVPLGNPETNTPTPQDQLQQQQNPQQAPIVIPVPANPQPGQTQTTGQPTQTGETPRP